MSAWRDRRGLPVEPRLAAGLNCSAAAAGLTTLYRDKAFLAMDEEQRETRMLVLSKTLGSAWIKTEAQAIIDRAKVARTRPLGGENVCVHCCEKLRPTKCFHVACGCPAA